MKLPREARRHHGQRHQADALRDRDEFFAEPTQPVHLVHPRDAVRDDGDKQDHRQCGQVEDEVAGGFRVEGDERRD